MTQFAKRPLLLAAALAGFSIAAVPSIQAFELGFAMDVLDPGFCMMPPPEMTDAELIGMMDDETFAIPIEGTITGAIDGDVAGDGYFGRDATSEAIATTIVLLIRDSEDALSGLCIALIPVGDTDSADGEMPLLGIHSEPGDGDAYMAFSRLIERDDEGQTHTITEIETRSGTIAFSEDDGMNVFGTMTLSGTGRDEGPYEGQNFEMAFEFAFFEGLAEFTRIDPLDE